jgi:hypothetical protein
MRHIIYPIEGADIGPSVGWPEILAEEQLAASGEPMPSQREMTGG